MEAFLDESGTHKESPTVCVAAVDGIAHSNGDDFSHTGATAHSTLQIMIPHRLNMGRLMP